MLSSYPVKATNTGCLFFPLKNTVITVKWMSPTLFKMRWLFTNLYLPHIQPLPRQIRCSVLSVTFIIDGSDAFPLFCPSRPAIILQVCFAVTQTLWQGHQLLHWQYMLLMDEMLHHKLIHPTFSYGLLFLVHMSCCLNSII